MSSTAEIGNAMHGELVLYTTRPTSAGVNVRALTGLMVLSPAEARQLAADLLNRADLIDPPDPAEVAS